MLSLEKQQKCQAWSKLKISTIAGQRRELTVRRRRQQRANHRARSKSYEKSAAGVNCKDAKESQIAFRTYQLKDDEVK